MIFRVGFQSFEVQQTLELPKPLTFKSRDEALSWLKSLALREPLTTLRFREFLSRFSSDPEFGRFSDHDALDRMAELLFSRKVSIVAREMRSGAAAKPAETQTAAAAFPLSERSSRRGATTSSPPAAVEDPPTFDMKMDGVAQAAVLVAAANEAMPFCPE